MKNDNTLIIVVIIILVLFLFGGFGMMGFGGGMINSFYGGFGFMWFGWLFMILITIALVLFILWIVKQLQNSGGKRR